MRDLSLLEMRIVWDETLNKLRFISNDRQDLDALVENFSYPNPTAFFSKQYGFNAPDKVSVINKFGYFDIGLIYDVLDYIKTLYGSLKNLKIDKVTFAKIKSSTMPYEDFVSTHPIEDFKVSNISKDRQLRDYQENIIRNLIYKGKGNGLFESPTSSGKSFILSNYIWTIHSQIDKDAKFLILVPNKQLVSQFYSDMLDYGFSKDDIAMFSAGISKTEKAGLKSKIVIISNRQYLFNNTKDLPKIDVLINDEVHQTKSKSATIELIEKLNPRVRVGCSGTLPKSKYELYTLKGIFVSVVHSENLLDLQNKGYISSLQIDRIKIFDRYVDANHDLGFSLNSTKHFSAENEISFNESWDEETKYIVDNFKKLYSPAIDYILDNYKGNILILFDRKQFGTSLYELTKEGYGKSYQCYYIDGDVPVDKREEIRHNVEDSNNSVIFAQAATFSTGINIKNLPNLCFCCNGKSFSRVVQSIGRILRLHKDKDYAQLIDLEFNFKYSQRHTKERNKIYKEIYGKPKIREVANIQI